MSINRKLGDLANVLDDGTEGQVLSFNASGAIAAADIAAGASVYDSAELLPLTGLSAGDMAYVTGTNRFYISNGTGWYSVSLVNTNPSITSVQDSDGGTTPFTLTTDGTATVITVTASDPEDVPLTYNYSVTAGSLTNGGGTTATVSQADNVFTITPSTTEAYAGTFSLTFTASDGINTDTSVNSFTLEFITIIANSNYTTLLATAVDTSDNNNITDASTNNHSITVTGDAHAGTFSPYRSGGYATSFSRSASSELEIASMPAIGSGDCSIECWVKINSQAWNGIVSRGAYVSSGTFSLSTRSGDSEITLVWSGSIYTTSGANININEWNWIQVVRSSGTITIYVNGISRKSVSNSANISSTSNYIIGRVDSSDYFGGQIRDLRISTNAQSSSNGSEKLATDSNTTFLSCHLPYLSYATSSVASNTYSSISGTIETVSSSPYDYEEYDAADHGGSVYFDGSGDSLNTTATQIIPSTSFTVTAWVYLNDTTDGAVWGQGTAGHSGRTGITIDNNSWFAQIGSANLGTSTSVSANRWYYTDFQWDGSTLEFFVDGTSLGSVSNSNSPTNSAFYIGDLGSAWSVGFPLNGYVSDLKVVSGTPSGSSTVPTAPLSSSGAALHLKGTDASIIDKSQVNNIVMNGPTTGSTTKSAFGSEPTISFASGSNTNRYLNFDPNVLNFMEILGQPSIPFTIEGIWGWQGSTASPIFEIFQDTNNFFYFGAGTGNTQSGISTDINLYAIFKIGGVERFKMTAGIGGYNVVGSTFKHQAITRNSSGLMQHYYDGQLRPTTITHTGFDTVNWTSPVGYIGRSDWMGIYGRYEGYIHQIRLTVGLARYTANFTPPTASLEG